MLAKLALIVTIATSPTQFTETVVAILPYDQCMTAQEAIWAIPAETVGYDEMGAVPALDAACVDPSEVK